MQKYDSEASETSLQGGILIPQVLQVLKLSNQQVTENSGRLQEKPYWRKFNSPGDEQNCCLQTSNWRHK